MEAQTFIWSCLVALATCSLSAAPVEIHSGVTRVPSTYLIHYAADAPRNPRFVESLSNAPPDVLHLGHAVPLNSIFGPTADYSGWNPKLVGADEILRRRAELRQFVDSLHRLGIGRVICYINPSILGGDHEKGLGFWAFFERWNDYEPLGLGPKPARPPELWMQRDRRSFAPWEPEPNYPLWRYQPCPNEPAWIRYQSAVVRLIAECGYDGVFVDDCIMECRHDLCDQRFPDFLKGRYGPEVLRQIFGDNLNLSGRQIMRSQVGPDKLRSAETYLFWQESVAGFLEEMNRAGRAVNPQFFTLPNWGATARVKGATARAWTGKSSAVWRKAAIDQMFEEDHPAGFIGSDDVIGYLLQYNYGLELGVRPAILSYGTTRRHVELGHAEAAAGGGGAYVEPTPAFPEVRRKWRAFFTANRELFEGFRLVAPVGLLFSFDEPRYGNDAHLRDVLALARTLYKLHVPFAAVPAGSLTSGRLARHRVIIAPDARYLAETQLASLRAFVRGGGRLLITGSFGGQNEMASPRQEGPFADAPELKAVPDAPALDPAQGAVFRLKSLSEIVPKREFAIVDALDIRDRDKFVARVRELGSAPSEHAAYDAFRQRLNGLAGGDLSLTKSTPAVCTVVYERLGASQGWLIVHAVRYAASTWGGDELAGSSSPIRLEVPLPAGWTVKQAAVLSPDKPSTVIAAEVDSQKVRCMLPAFEYYSLLKLELRTAK